MTHDTSPIPRLASRPLDSHKGDYGRVLLIGGSQGMAGAIALAGMSTLRSGAGLVTLATPAVCQPTVASFEPGLMTIPLPCDPAGRITLGAFTDLERHLHSATVIAIGPGLGQSDDLTTLVGKLYRDVPQPMILDADALNALARQTHLLPHASGKRILTPHPGEFARLTGRERIPTNPEERETLARDFARHNQLTVVLKGHHTIITDGEHLALNQTGNAGMATGGTGDILTGIITAITTQHLEPYAAARLGCHVHGLAGDLAASELGEISLIASDLIRFLPTAWQLHQSNAT